jgi:hypothetical protein
MEINHCTVIRHDDSTYVFINMEALEAINSLIDYKKECHDEFSGDFEVITSPTIISKNKTVDPGIDTSLNDKIVIAKKKRKGEK